MKLVRFLFGLICFDFECNFKFNFKRIVGDISREQQSKQSGWLETLLDVQTNQRTDNIRSPQLGIRISG